MNAARKQKNFWQSWIFSINAVYRLISNYGTSPLRAFGFFVVFVLLHAYATPKESEIWMRIGYSIQVMTLQRGNLLVHSNEFLTGLNVVFSIIGPVLIALIALSMRNRIRRY